jgi:uncharacterized protein (DUF2062 family)
MRGMRGIVNAMLMATLVKPMVRLAVARWRKRAREAAPEAISLPMQQLVEAALVQELSPALAELEMAEAGEPLESAGNGTLRTAIIMGGVLTVVSASMAVAVTVIRRRREAARRARRVAIPVETETGEHEVTAEAEEALAR